MRSSIFGFAVSLFLLCFSSSLHAAPARAIYYTDFQTIIKVDPVTLEQTTLFENALTGSATFERLVVDSPNGHLYWIDSKRKIHRGNLDGTGATIIYTGTSSFLIKDLVVSPTTGNLFIATDREGVIEYDPVAQTSTVRHVIVSDTKEFIGPRLYLDRATSKVYWSEVHGRLWTWDPVAETSTPSGLPVEAATLGSPHKSQIVFTEDGTLIPYSLGQSGSNFYSTLFIGGLDGNAAAQHALQPSFVPSPGPEMRIDTDAGYIYVFAQTIVDSEHIPGLYRMKLDTSERTVLFPVADIRGELAIDTADLDDTQDPIVTIFSPIGGTTNNQNVSLIGSVSDDGVMDTITWSHDGDEQGPVSVFNGDFTVPSIALHPGDNLLEVTATDLAGNAGSAQVSLNWQPLRSLEITAPDSVREGRRSVSTVMLDSPGDVAGATFKLHYDPAAFESPKYELGEEIETASPVVNLSTPGEVSVTFANVGGTVASGAQELISVSLRARSVAENTSSELSVSVQDMADQNGTPIVVGTYVGNAQVEIVARTFAGDVNSNDRLDTGDASRMQAMLTGISEKRAWDELINDLNGSTSLDSGDVIRVLRTVVGIEDQPSTPAGGARNRRSSPQTDPNAPRARLILSEQHAAEGEKISVSVQLENITEAFSGASFALEYPPGALRLDGPADHSPGAVVGGDALLLWNLAPSQNDYPNQSGRITFGASSSSSWPGSASGGTLANFSFTVMPGATAETLWEISVRDVEISTDSGFEIEPLDPDTAIFIGNPQSFETWRAANFSAAELADLSVSGWQADPESDRRNNAIEYFSGSDANAINPEPILSVELVPVEGEHCLVARYQRSLSAIDATATLQSSTDLKNWEDITTGIETVIDLAETLETVTVTVETPPTGQRQYLRLKITLPE